MKIWTVRRMLRVQVSDERGPASESRLSARPADNCDLRQ